MTEAAEQLRALADRILAVYAERTRPRAALLAGSAGRGDADFYSDLDLLLYYHELPARSDVEAARSALGGELVRVMFDEEEGGFGETFELDGVQCQLGHLTIAASEEELDLIAAGKKLDTPLAKVVMGLIEGLPLCGEELIEAWRERVRYGDELQRAVIEKHWQFFPLWYFDQVLERRDALLWRQQVLVEAAFNLLSVLAALNRFYFTEFELKRTRDFVAKLELAPPNLADRLEHLFVPGADAGELEALVAETQALLAEHLPGLELPPLRKPLGGRARPWRHS
jgi:hypothetical protein